jgi:hydroxypyruvate isomerase
MNFSICAELFFTELPFPERLKKIAASGFSAVEFWAWKNKDVQAIKHAAEECNLTVAIFSGQRGGSLINPDDREQYVSEVEETITIAKQLHCNRLMVLTDELSPDGTAQKAYSHLSPFQKNISIVKGLERLAELGERHNITIVIEPLNTLIDHKGYYLNSTALACELVKEVGSKFVKVLYDIYHMQIMEGNVLNTIEKNLEWIGHFHAADVPGRHEFGTGELNYKNIFKRLKGWNYDGYVGLELMPSESSEKAIERIREVIGGL